MRARLFGVTARVAHGTGLLKLARPLLNRARLRIDREGHAAFPWVSFRGTRNAQILIYHRVNDEQDPYFPAVTPVLFDRQMAYLASNFRVLPVSDLVDGLLAGTLPDNAIAVSFDDGYRDNFVHAFPILKRHGIPCTVFLTTEAIGSDRQLWHDDVFSAFRETTAGALAPSGPEGIGGPLGTVEERLRVQRRFIAHARTLGDAGRSQAIAQLRQALGVGPSPPAPGLMLSWDEVRTMSRGGVQFGSHTATHPILSRVDREQARRELVESKRTIEERIGVPVEGFAYPNGTRADFLPETETLVREAGYAYAVTTIDGPNEPDADVFALKRWTPWDEDIFAFGLRLHYTKLRS